MIVWIERKLAIALHDRQLAEHGGKPGVRDQTLLDSALVRPQQAFACNGPPADIAALAASLAYGLARNHPFIDGNTRTAHVCYRTFLMLNGADLVASDEEKYTCMLHLADGTLDEADFARWLREHLQLQPDDSVYEAATQYAYGG